MARLLAVAMAFACGHLHAGPSDDKADNPVAEAPPKNPLAIEAKTAMGYESNPLEANNSLGQAKGSAFSETTVDLSVPLDGPQGVFTATFSGLYKPYFERGNLDEYNIQPGLRWRAIDTDATTLKLNMYVSRYRVRVYNQLEPIANYSAEGWGGGMMWNLESKLSEKIKLLWEGNAGYQVFDSIEQNNGQDYTRVAFEKKVSDKLKLIAGTAWSFQGYKNRPPDAPAHNPPDWQMLVGRGFIGQESTLGADWTLVTELSGGHNFDLTNGYYDANDIGGKVEVRWKVNKWKLKASANPEFLWYGNRPANFGRSQGNLRTRGCAFECGVEYAWTDSLDLFLSQAVHEQVTNSNETQPNPTYNNFTDSTSKGGVMIAF